MKSITVGKFKIAQNYQPYFIAEAGVNHNGKLSLALKMVDAAARIGANAVKFQTFKAAEVTIANNSMAEYQRKNTNKNFTQLELLKKIELKKNFYGPIIEHCKKRKIEFLSTPHGGFGSVDFLRSLHVRAYKFGSGDLNNLPLLSYAAKDNIPIILGTGMSTLEEVRAAIKAIHSSGNKKIVVLHATTNYPCPLHEVNLRAMQTMMRSLPCLVGYSDHTAGIEAALAAFTLGACVIEKHFTLDRGLPGPDHKASATPEELNILIKMIRNTSILLGSSEKKPNKSELPMIRTTRKSIVSTAEIRKGEFFSHSNIGIKRPGTGLPPSDYNKIIGKKSKRNINADVLIRKNWYD